MKVWGGPGQPMSSMGISSWGGESTGMREMFTHAQASMGISSWDGRVSRIWVFSISSHPMRICRRGAGEARLWWMSIKHMPSMGIFFWDVGASQCTHRDTCLQGVVAGTWRVSRISGMFHLPRASKRHLQLHGIRRTADDVLKVKCLQILGRFSAVVREASPHVARLLSLPAGRYNDQHNWAGQCPSCLLGRLHSAKGASPWKTSRESNCISRKVLDD